MSLKKDRNKELLIEERNCFIKKLRGITKILDEFIPSNIEQTRYPFPRDFKPYRVLVVGASRVGKSCFVNKLVSSLIGSKQVLCPFSDESTTHCLWKIRYGGRRMLNLFTRGGGKLEVVESIDLTQKPLGKLIRVMNELKKVHDGGRVGYYDGRRILEVELRHNNENLFNFEIIDTPCVSKINELEYDKSDLILYLIPSNCQGGIPEDCMEYLKKVKSRTNSIIVVATQIDRILEYGYHGKSNMEHLIRDAEGEESVWKKIMEKREKIAEKLTGTVFGPTEIAVENIFVYSQYSKNDGRKHGEIYEELSSIMKGKILNLEVKRWFVTPARNQCNSILHKVNELCFIYRRLYDQTKSLSQLSCLENVALNNVLKAVTTEYTKHTEEIRMKDAVKNTIFDEVRRCVGSIGQINEEDAFRKVVVQLLNTTSHRITKVISETFSNTKNEISNIFTSKIMERVYDVLEEISRALQIPDLRVLLFSPNERPGKGQDMLDTFFEVVDSSGIELSWKAEMAKESVLVASSLLDGFSFFWKKTKKLVQNTSYDERFQDEAMKFVWRSNKFKNEVERITKFGLKVLSEVKCKINIEVSRLQKRRQESLTLENQMSMKKFTNERIGSYVLPSLKDIELDLLSLRYEYFDKKVNQENGEGREQPEEGEEGEGEELETVKPTVSVRKIERKDGYHLHCDSSNNIVVKEFACDCLGEGNEVVHNIMNEIHILNTISSREDLNCLMRLVPVRFAYKKYIQENKIAASYAFQCDGKTLADLMTPENEAKDNIDFRMNLIIKIAKLAQYFYEEVNIILGRETLNEENILICERTGRIGFLELGASQARRSEINMRSQRAEKELVFHLAVLISKIWELKREEQSVRNHCGTSIVEEFRNLLHQSLAVDESIIHSPSDFFREFSILQIVQKRVNKSQRQRTFDRSGVVVSQNVENDMRRIISRFFPDKLGQFEKGMIDPLIRKGESSHSIVVISDIHFNRYRDPQRGMGWKNYPDYGANELCQFLKEYVVENQIEFVVLAGDIFDMWSCPSSKLPTKPKDLGGKILELGQVVRELTNTSKNGWFRKFIYCRGNHDHLLKTQDIRDVFGPRVIVCDAVRIGDVWIEHGHRFDLFNMPVHGYYKDFPLGYFLTRMEADALGPGDSQLKRIQDMFEGEVKLDVKGVNVGRAASGRRVIEGLLSNKVLSKFQGGINCACMSLFSDNVSGKDGKPKKVIIDDGSHQGIQVTYEDVLLSYSHFFKHHIVKYPPRVFSSLIWNSIGEDVSETFQHIGGISKRDSLVVFGHTHSEMQTFMEENEKGYMNTGSWDREKGLSFGIVRLSESYECISFGLRRYLPRKKKKVTPMFEDEPDLFFAIGGKSGKVRSGKEPEFFKFELLDNLSSAENWMIETICTRFDPRKEEIVSHPKVVENISYYEFFRKKVEMDGLFKGFKKSECSKKNWDVIRKRWDKDSVLCFEKFQRD